jgi:hypothetical protein
MVTFTASHSLDDKLGDLLDRFKKALRYLGKDGSFSRLTQLRSGSVVATEVTYSPRSGWHPHSHQAWFFPAGIPVNCDELASELFPIWERSCAKVGLTTLESFRGHRVGVDVREAWDAADYLTKWGREREWDLAAEVTAGRIKLARGQSLTPWAILEDAILRGKDSYSAGLWIEYLRGTKGFHCVSLRGARALLMAHGLPTNYDDWADANKAGQGEVLATVGAHSFNEVVRAGGLGRLLEAARSGGLSALDAELLSLVSST